MVQGDGGYIEVVDRFGRSLEFVPVYSTNLDIVFKELSEKYGPTKGSFGFHFYYLRACETLSDLSFYLESDDDQVDPEKVLRAMQLDDLRALRGK